MQEIKRRGGQIRERDDYKGRGYHVYGRDKKAPKDLELAKALLGGHLRDKEKYPTHAEDRLYRFLQIKEEELTEAGLLTVMPDDLQKVRKEREKGNIIASGPRTIFSKLKEEEEGALAGDQGGVRRGKRLGRALGGTVLARPNGMA